MTWRIALVLNDGTRGDLLLQREDCETFLVVQLKTTHKSTEKGTYRFKDVFTPGVRGYDDMPVVCWCEAAARGWLAYGAALSARKKCDLHITPGARLEREFTRTSGDMQELVTFLAEHADDWPSFTEEAARHDLPSKSHQIEMQGIDAYKRSFPVPRLRMARGTEWPHGPHGGRCTRAYRGSDQDCA